MIMYTSMPCKLDLSTNKNMLLQFSNDNDLKRFLSLFAFTTLRKTDQLDIGNVKVQCTSNTIACILKESGFSYEDLTSVMHYLTTHRLITDTNMVSDLLLQGWKRLEHKNAFFGIKSGLPTCSLYRKKNVLYVKEMNLEFLSKPGSLYKILSSSLGENNNISVSTDPMQTTIEIVFSHSDIKSKSEKIVNAFLAAQAIDEASKAEFSKSLEKAVMKDMITNEISTLTILMSDDGPSPIKRYSYEITTSIALLQLALKGLDDNASKVKWVISQRLRNAPKLIIKGIEKMLKEFPGFIHEEQ